MLNVLYKKKPNIDGASWRRDTVGRPGYIDPVASGANDVINNNDVTLKH